MLYIYYSIFFLTSSLTVAGIRSPNVRKGMHDDAFSNIGETPSDPRCELSKCFLISG